MENNIFDKLVSVSIPDETGDVKPAIKSAVESGKLTTDDVVELLSAALLMPKLMADLIEITDAFDSLAMDEPPKGLEYVS